MQKRANYLSWRTTAKHNCQAEFKLSLCISGLTNSAGIMRGDGQDGVERRATCSRGATECVSNHSGNSLDEQHTALEEGRGNRQRLPREIMGKYFDNTKTQFSLFSAWRRIRENGYLSSLEETRWAVEQFDREANRNIIKLQRRISKGQFQFDPQIGVTKKKKNGSKRGIVMASIQNRIVERSLLDTLQSKSEFIKNVITTPTSVGGVPERSVPHGLKMINEAMEAGFFHFVRSDISGFFDNVPREKVLERISQDVDDAKFLELLDNATKVTLANEIKLGEDRKIFPTDSQGVAQGSPLSALFGNVLLYDFDQKFNKDKVICIRFIDDFILLSKDKRRVTKAFESAKSYLNEYGLVCHDPFQADRIDKAEHGEVQNGFVFLGYDIRPGLFQPSRAARKSLMVAVKDRIRTGKKNIISVLKEPDSLNSHYYAQTMVSIDRVLRGWGNAFAYSNAQETGIQLDEKVDEEIKSFKSWYAQQLKHHDWRARRRAAGVCLISDIETKKFSDVPFRIEAGGRFVRSSRNVTISTDGSVLNSKRKSLDKGNGGWAYVVHENNKEVFGSCEGVTNNQMELKAVIEAIKATPTEKSICIRTDSQYVCQIAQGNNVAKSNGDMWKEYQEVIKDRKIKIVWVKGHSGDPQNERADKLANQAAKTIPNNT